MTTFYRTPDILIDAHEWHVIVESRSNGRVSAVYRWRPVAAKTHRWLSIETWAGPKPLGLWRYFAKYKPHIEFAKGSIKRRAEAVAALSCRKVPPTGAMTRNVGAVRVDALDRPNCNACNGFCYCRAAKNNRSVTSLIC
jgi:hypothetical protein